MLSIKRIKERIYKISPTYRIIKKLSYNTNLALMTQKKEILAIKNQNKKISEELSKISKENIRKKLGSITAGSFFGGHYNIWRQKRIDAFINHYGINWFKDKKILELGCGYADIGNIFYHLGADVTVSDARGEHIKVVNEKYPHLKTFVHNCEEDLPFKKKDKFDLIIHTGMLYHIDKYEDHLKDCLKYCDNMILEAEVCDSDNKDFDIYVEEESEVYDKSFTKKSYRPSPSKLEKIITQSKRTFIKLEDDSCDAGMHIYSWKIKNTKTWKHGLRAMWFIK